MPLADSKNASETQPWHSVRVSVARGEIIAVLRHVRGERGRVFYVCFLPPDSPEYGNSIREIETRWRITGMQTDRRLGSRIKGRWRLMNRSINAAGSRSTAKAHPFRSDRKRRGCTPCRAVELIRFLDRTKTLFTYTRTGQTRGARRTSRSRKAIVCGVAATAFGN